jgi:hypothetical protein
MKLNKYLGLVSLIISVTSQASGSAAMQAKAAANEIAELIQPTLQQEGFLRKGQRWYSYEKNATAIIEVQTAKYSPGPYINLGIFYLKYGESKYPKIVDCQIYTRVLGLVPNPERLNDLLDPTNGIPRDIRGKELADAFHSYLIPWLRTMTDVGEAKSVLMKNPRVAHVAVEAREDFGLPPYSLSTPP